MKTMTKIWFATLCSIAVAMTVGCASAPDTVQTYDFDDEKSASQAFSAWLDGEERELDSVDLQNAADIFLVAETSYWDGDVEEAYRWYVMMLRDHPGHALNRYAAFRLYQLRGQVVNFADRLRVDLDGVSFDGEGSLTRLELVRLSHYVERQKWLRSESAEPFKFTHGGALHKWRATPILSPWRLRDFDQPMPPENQERFAESYRSPLIATADSANDRLTRNVSLQRPRERFALGGTGIYYMESFLTVEGAKRRDFTIHGRFPGAARVWIDGEEVLERREDGYDSGRVSRSVRLTPGSHRVLVKLAYVPGSRNWFELFAVPQQGEIFGDAGLHVDFEAGNIETKTELRAEQREAIDLEPVQVDADGVEEASGPALYAAAISAYASSDTESFEVVWEELMRRHPDFVAGHLLGSYQVRTRWDVPSEVRDSAAISRLRQAQELEPENLHILVQLERRLRDGGEEREHRQILQKARELTMDVAGDEAAEEGRQGVAFASTGQFEPESGARDDGADPLAVRQIRPLVAWARYLEEQRWSEDAEEAWREVLRAEPAHCTAMQKLQGLYRSRQYMPEPDEISPQWATCPSVVSRWLREHPERLEERRDFAQRQAQRYPYDANRQVRYSEALRAVGQRVEAEQVLDEAVARMPESSELWIARIDLAMLAGDDEATRRIIGEATEIYGRSAELEWMRARLGDEIPLQGLMRDGLQAAMEEVRRTGAGEEVDEAEIEEDQADDDEPAMVLDDAYYVIDFSGRKYFEDGSSWTLTHRMVRVMTRGAIDRYAELSVPRGAYLLEARTIKEDGEVRFPEGVSGDSTMSMPGLARGDMVEVAYLQFRSPGQMASHVQGHRFYFQRPNISSRTSELAIIGSQDFEFESANGVPEPESFDFEGDEAVRFVARDTRRPRSEPRRVNAVEYLPWIREVRVGFNEDVLDVERRYMQDAVRGSTQRSSRLDRHLESWLGRELEEGTAKDEEIRKLYYEAAKWFRSHSSGAFRTDAAHAVEERSGSPLVVLRVALDALGVENDIYVARGDEEPPQEQMVGEIGRFRKPVLRVVMPDSGDVQWLQLDRRDAMFGAIEPEIDGQPALCITCDELHRETVSTGDDRRSRRHIEVAGKLDEAGTLTGELSYEFAGDRAARVRSALRNRTDEQDREDYFERVLTEQISGANLTGYDVVGEDEPDGHLRFTLNFERGDFARSEDEGLVVDRNIFREPMQRLYAQQSSRLLPMFIGYDRSQTYSLTIELPEGMESQLRATDVDAEQGQSQFASFERRSWIEEGALRLESSIDLRRQRIYPDDYDAFRQWATIVEESAGIWLGLDG